MAKKWRWRTEEKAKLTIQSGDIIICLYIIQVSFQRNRQQKIFSNLITTIRVLNLRKVLSLARMMKYQYVIIKLDKKYCAFFPKNYSLYSGHATPIHY
jgi:hypothetical protein